MTQSPTTTPEDTIILEEMFVQIARSVTSDQTTLTLQDVAPSTLYFSDRPERVVGHMTTEQFVEQWSEGPNSFLEDPPNAVLSYVGAGEDTLRCRRDPARSDGLGQYPQLLHRGARRHRARRIRGSHPVHRSTRPPAKPGVAGRDEPPQPPPRPAPIATTRHQRRPVLATSHDPWICSAFRRV